MKFEPWRQLIAGKADPACRAIVIIPARNEQDALSATLDHLADQINLDGSPLDRTSYEVLLLLNNCTDSSYQVASQWRRQHPDTWFYIAERTLEPGKAFVGTARRMLMDTAWHRLTGNRGVCGILSTDADTLVSRDWIAQNLSALRVGVEAVGGVIALKSGDLELLPRGVRRAYLQDRRYQRLVAELEDWLDPQDGDPWPRHLAHFGASLACTPEAYARAGGMPAVTPLEDVAFVNALRRVGARIRHHLDVKVFTSSRLRGRVDVGLSGQLRIWQEMSERGEPHRVQSAAWLAHRFRTLKRLRVEASQQGIAAEDYLVEMDCERVAAETFRGEAQDEISRTNWRLAALLHEQRSSKSSR